MAIVNPSREHIEAFARETPDAKPIIMVNLLKFRERADYGDSVGTNETGKRAYARYSKGVIPLLLEVGGQPLWMGKARAGVIVPDGESWDEILLVHYPSRQAFVRMVSSNAYQAIVHYRTAALSDSRLIETRAVALPKLFLRVARGVLQAKALVWPKVTPSGGLASAERPVD